MDCPQSIPLYERRVEQFQASIDVLQHNHIDFVLDDNGSALVSLIIPSGSLNSNARTRESRKAGDKDDL